MDNKKLGFGMMRLPMTADGAKVDIPATCKVVDAFLGRGFTYFDTAWMYCNFQSEDAVKEVLTKRYPREAFTLTTKLHSGFISTLEDRDRIFNTQREKTGLEYFDFYWLHDINSHSIEIYNRLDCFNWLIDKKKQGLVKHIGFSFHDGPELLKAVLEDHPEMEYVQLQINYLDWDSVSIRSRECYETAVSFGKKVIVMEPVRGGTLARLPEKAEKLFKEYAPEASVPSWAIRFAASHDSVYKVLSGMNTVEQVLDNTGYMNEFVPFSEEEFAIVKKAAGIINESVEIPCTGCKYCVPGCPMQIQIPKCFSLYNVDKQEVASKGWTPQGEYYENMTEFSGKASSCIGCRQCENICPQHLPVTKYLKTVAAYFEK